MGEPSQQQSVWFWRESCINVANNSDFKVSYWIEQECKMKTRAIQETVVTTMDTKLNGKAGVDGADVVLGASCGLDLSVRASKRARTENTVAKEQTEEVSYFLMKDHRWVRARASRESVRTPTVRCITINQYSYFRTAVILYCCRPSSRRASMIAVLWPTRRVW